MVARLNAIQQVRRVTSARFVRGVAIIAGGSALAQAVPLAMTPVLSRLYTPADLGTFGLYTAFLSVLSTATTLGYAHATVSAEDDAEAAELTLLAAVFTIPFACTSVGLLVLLVRQSWLGYGDLPIYAAPAMFLSLLLTGTYFSLRYWLLRFGAYGVISRATVGQSVGRVLAQLCIGLVRPSWMGLVGGEVVGRGVGLTSMWQVARNGYRQAVDGWSISRVRRTARKYRKFPLLTVPSSFLDSLGAMLPVPLVAAVFGVAAAGQYSLAVQSLLLPLSLVSASVADVFHNRIVERARYGPAAARRFFFQVAFALLTVGAAPITIVAFWGDRLIPFVLGSSWNLAGQLAATVAPRLLSQLLVSPLSRVVLVYQRQELKLIYDVLSPVTIGVVFFVAREQHWAVLQTIRVLTWLQVGLHGLYLALLLKIVSQPLSRRGGGELTSA